MLLYRRDQNIPHNQPLAVGPGTVLGKIHPSATVCYCTGQERAPTRI